MRDAHPWVVPISPSNKPHFHTKTVNPPESWMPPSGWAPRETSLTEDQRNWFKADAIGLAAIVEHEIDADFYWFIESDVVASQFRWRALFSDHETSMADCISPRLRFRGDDPGCLYWKLNGTPEWTDAWFIMACFRLSRRAVEECIRRAEEMRECFSEVSIASVLRRAGMSFMEINANTTHFNSLTFAAGEKFRNIHSDPNLINHPVKLDTYDVPSREAFPVKFRIKGAIDGPVFQGQDLTVPCKTCGNKTAFR